MSNLKAIDIGCGQDKKVIGGYQFDYLDLHKDVNPTIIADARKIPKDDESYDLVYSSNLLEHFNKNEIIPVLKEWIRILKPGGKLVLMLPDLDYAMSELKKGNLDIALRFIYGGQGYENNQHGWGFNKQIIEKYLEGFPELEINSIETEKEGRDIIIEATKIMNKTIDIIIPVFNQLEYTQKCIKSVQKNTKNYNLIIINNGSTDGTSKYLEELNRLPEIIIIDSDTNQGFVVATNQGLKVSKNDVVLLNNDTEVSEGWLDMLKESAENTEVGAVGPLSSAIDQEQYFGHYKEKWTGEYLAFFCCLIKREVINKIGLLDENIEIGMGDDNDYCTRIKKEGYKLCLNTSIIVTHHHRTTIKTIPNMEQIAKKNIEYLNTKYNNKGMIQNLQNKKKVYVAIPNEWNIHPSLHYYMRMLEDDPRYETKTRTPARKTIDNNRNLIVKEFLETDYDYLLMIDSDIIPTKNILDLVELDKDVIGGVCPQWHEDDMYWVVMDRVEDGYKQVPIEKRGGLKEVDAIGSGCMLIARRVLEKVKAPFERKWSEDGIQELGLDFYFCQKAKNNRFKVWAHWEYVCSHWVRIDLLNVAKLLSKNG